MNNISVRLSEEFHIFLLKAQKNISIADEKSLKQLSQTEVCNKIVKYFKTNNISYVEFIKSSVKQNV